MPCPQSDRNSYANSKAARSVFRVPEGQSQEKVHRDTCVGIGPRYAVFCFHPHVQHLFFFSFYFSCSLVAYRSLNPVDNSIDVVNIRLPNRGSPAIFGEVLSSHHCRYPEKKTPRLQALLQIVLCRPPWSAIRQ